MASTTTYPLITLSSMLEDCVISGLSSGVAYNVFIYYRGGLLFNETLTADSNGEIKLIDMPSFFENTFDKYGLQQMSVALQDSSGSWVDEGPGGFCWLYEGNIDCHDFMDFKSKFFLCPYRTRRTSVGRKELLSFVEIETGREPTGMSGSVRAYYTDGTYKDFAIEGEKDDFYSVTKSDWEEDDDFHWINMYEVDASPEQFESEGKTLYRYVVQCGERTMEYVMDPEHEDADTAFLYKNCFGVWDAFYCNGKTETEDTFEREGTYINGVYKNYKVTEVKNFNCDTGVLMPFETALAQDLLRSKSVYMCKRVNGEYTKWKEVVITDCEATHTNEPGNLPRYTFTCRFAQKRQNTLDWKQFPEIFTEQYTSTYE